MPKFTVHRNGTSAEALKRNHVAVMNAIRTLDEALRECVPNMRDYYVSETGDADFKADIEELQGHFRAVYAMNQWAEDAAARAMNQGE